jgi:hypothetical protein
MLRVAILLDGPAWKRWEAECVRLLLDSNRAVVPLLMMKKSAPDRHGGSLAWRALRRWLTRASSSLAAAEEALPPAPILMLHEDGAQELGKLKRYGLDAILSFHKGELNPGLLRAAKYGVWEFRYGDDLFRDAAGYSYRNLLDGGTTSAVALVRRGEEPGTEFVLREGALPAAAHSYARNIDAIHRFSASWPALVCRDIAAGRLPGSLKRPKPPRMAGADLAALISGPTAKGTAQLIWKTAARKARNFFARWFVAEHWNVGVVDRPIDRFLDAEPADPSEIRWFPRRRRYIADPFGMQIDGKLHVLVEEYDYGTNKGVIKALLSEEEEGGEARPAIELPVHMSYPYLLRERDEIFCIPETHQASEVSLYKAVEFPGRWEKIGVLIRDFRAVDATVFRHDGRWWLFCTDESEGPNSHLHIWYAEELTGPWLPHPLNPVKMDIRSARPAGTPFQRDGQLFRPAQDCSATYGGAVMINRILALSTTEFAEETVHRLAPLPESPYGEGLHTLSSAGSRTLIDAKVETVDLKVFALRVKARVKMLLQGSAAG